MTAAIGTRIFSPPTTQAATGGEAGRSQAHTDDEAPAFGNLLHEARKRTSVARHSHEPGAAADAAATSHGRTEAADDKEPASAADDGQIKKIGRYPHRAAHDRPAEEDGRERDRAAADGAQPLRDRLPLLVTLHALGHRDAADRSVGGNAAVETRPAGLAQHLSASNMNLPEVAVGPASPTGAAAPVEPTSETAAIAVMAASSGRAAQRGATPAGDAAASSSGKPDAKDGIADRHRSSSEQKTAAPPAAAATGALQSSPSDLAEGEGGEAVPPAVMRTTAGGRETTAEKEARHRTGVERPAQGSISVAADRSFPAPASHPLSPTTASVIDALATMRNQPAATPVSQPVQPPAVALPTQILRIELHPAELGAVVASLRMAGEQLSIELRPETAEAYRRLSDDSETITKSLKKLGFDVDAVTIMQPSVAATPVARVDGGNQTPAGPGRDASQFQSGTSGGNGGDFGGQQSGRNRGHDGQAFERPAPAHRERAGGALFI